MSGGFELYIKMAEEMARTNNLNVVAKLPKPFRPNQFSYLLMSLLYGTAFQPLGSPYNQPTDPLRFVRPRWRRGPTMVMTSPLAFPVSSRQSSRIALSR